MPVETPVTFIHSLNAANPLDTDFASDGDNHIRNIKAAVKATFPNVNAAVNPTPAELNKLVGLTATTVELNRVVGTTAPIQTQLDSLSLLKLNAIIYTAADVLAKILTVDGAGSTLDADTLDGLQAAFLRDASNLDAGTVPDARLNKATNPEAIAGTDSLKIMDAVRVREVLIAALSGFAGMPVLKLNAIEPVTAGNTIRSRDDGTNSNGNNGSAKTAHSFSFIQRGTVRCTYNYSATSSTVFVTRTRNGVISTMQSFNSGSGGASVDVDVLPGDMISFGISATGGTGSNSISFCRIKTNGENLWPGQPGPVENTY